MPDFIFRVVTRLRSFAYLFLLDLGMWIRLRPFAYLFLLDLGMFIRLRPFVLNFLLLSHVCGRLLLERHFCTMSNGILLFFLPKNNIRTTFNGILLFLFRAVFFARRLMEYCFVLLLVRLQNRYFCSTSNEILLFLLSARVQNRLKSTISKGKVYF